ncbi:MAG TPA: lysylphosphatidylglycerol synthase transmembrane domain-containing protein [Candidatus Dormibacteraeota bacterium]|nr:lysylphosphatidylglycerol synthase transmembrane domain-containing protein [Candidatus Dormibacteraeota bacterium]
MTLLLMAVRELRALCGAVSAAWANPWHRGAASTLVGVVALAVLLRSMPLSQVAQHLQPRHLTPLLAIVALTLLGQLVRAARWALLLRGRAHVGLLEALWVNAATGLANYVLPFRTGEGLRLWWLAKRQRQPPAAALGLIVADHAFDLGGVTAVLGAGTVLKATATDSQLPALPALAIILSLAAGALVMIAGGAYLGPRLVTCRPIRRKLSRFWTDALTRHSVVFWSGLGSVPRRRLALLLATSALAVSLDGLAFAMLFSALGLGVPIASAVVAQVTLLFMYLLPAAPGYVGSLEAGGTLLLTSIGLAPGAAAGAIILWHALATASIVGLGVVALYRILRVSKTGCGTRE